MSLKLKYVPITFALASCAQACICMPSVSFGGSLIEDPARLGRLATVPAGLVRQNNEKKQLPLGLAAVDLRYFEAAMQRISGTAHVAIVAEGVPLRAELNDAETNDLLKALSSSSDTSVPATLTLVAQAYDYDVERGVDRGYILRKHYSDPTDLPNVTFQEVEVSLRSLLRLIDGDRTSPPANSDILASFHLYDSLSESQKATAQSDTGLILTLADLGPEQKNYAIELARHITVDSKTSAIRRCLQHLMALHDKSAAFRWTAHPVGMTFGQRGTLGAHPRPSPDFGSPFFVYGIPWGRQSNIKEFPLNHGFKIGIDSSGTQVSASTIARISSIRHETQSGTAQIESPTTSTGDSAYDPSVPTLQDKLLAPGMMSNKLVSTVTLTDLAESLSAKKLAPKGTVALSVTVDAALDGKPVTVYGRDHVPSDALIRLAARVYGLQISTVDNKSIYITTPRVRPVHGTSDLQAEIKRVIPPSLLRSFESQIGKIAGPAPLNARASGGSDITEQKRMPEEKMERDRRSAAAIAAEGSWYFPADRRLLVLGEAAVPNPGSPPVSVASLGEEPSRLITLMLLTAGPLVRMRDLLDFEPPFCLTDPSTLQILLTCHEHGKRQGIGVKIQSLVSTGGSKYEGMSIFSHDAPP